MYVNTNGILRSLFTDVCVKYKEHRSGYIASFALMSSLLVMPLPALGESFSVSSTAKQESPLLVANRFRQIRLGRPVTVQRRRPYQRPSQSPLKNRTSEKQPEQLDPYVASLSPEERQAYEIIQKAKRNIRQQPMADFLGSVIGISAKGVAQSPADLDREFQTVVKEIRDNSPAPKVEPTVNATVTPTVNDISPNSGVALTPKPGNRILQRILSKKSSETHQQWYARINPVIYYTPREEYSAWRETLLLSDKQTYDAIVKKEYQRGMEEVSNSVSDMIRRDLSCRRVPDPKGFYGETIEVCDD